MGTNVAKKKKVDGKCRGRKGLSFDDPEKSTRDAVKELFQDCSIGEKATALLLYYITRINNDLGVDILDYLESEVTKENLKGDPDGDYFCGFLNGLSMAHLSN